MIPITKTITAVLFIGLFATSMACEAKTNTKGKFHLIYLVSAEKLEVGAKVFVEPLFFTDGKRRVDGAWAYCRVRFVNDKPYPKASKVVEKAMYRYCLNQPFTSLDNNLTVINNNGTRITLSSIKFDLTEQTKPILEDGVNILLPALALIGTAKITSVSKKPVRLAISDNPNIGPRYFLFASSSKNILDKVIPGRRYSEKKMRPLFARALKYAEKVKGNRHKANKLDALRLAKDKVSVIATLFADFDNDGLLDLAVGMRTNHAIDRGRFGTMIRSWAAIGFLYGNGINKSLSNVYGGITFKNFLRIGYAPNTPLGIIGIGGCRYLISAPQGLMFFEFRPLPKETASCKIQRHFKQIEDMDG